jgi:Bacterial Ig-like domain (group 3)
MIRRGLRLELAAGLGMALSLPALAFAGQNTQGIATETTLQQELHDQAGRTQANLTVTVAGEDGLPATGPVVISDRGRQLAGAALNKQGQATIVVDLLPGDHSLTASYLGDVAHRSSVSDSAGAQATASTTPDFQISIAPASLSLGLGASGTVIASITPVNSSALTSPMFITLSCSGLPDQSSCTFNPENVEILPNATAAVTSSAVFVTQQQEGSLVRPDPARPDPARPGSNGVALAILLPGALGLGGLAWSMRRRPWLQRLSLLALVALVATLGTTGCNPQYKYYNHGPPINPSTPPGTYTVNVTAQSSDGVTATTHSTTLAFTVQ